MDTQRPVVVVGAGPAGIAAAVAASTAGPAVLLDEGHDSANVPEGIDYRLGTSVWALFPGPAGAAFDDRDAYSIDAGAVVVATGTVDRTWPVPGWHLERVVTARELLVSLREGRIAAGQRAGVIGSGPDADAAVTALGDAGALVARARDLASARIEGATRVERLRSGDDVQAVDWVVLALGRRPDPALALQARAASAFLRDALIAMPLLAGDGATSLPGVFVAGEAAGMTGPDAIRAHGARAGEAAARVARGEPQSTELHVPTLAGIPPLLLPSDPATIVDRHQGVNLATIRDAIASGAFDVNDLRRRTRAGMGSTGDAVPVLAALLLASDPAILDARLIARQRPPARPLPFRAVLDTPAGAAS